MAKPRPGANVVALSSRTGPDADTKQALARLLYDLEGDDSRDGKLIGLAYVACYERRIYAVGITGELRRNPTFARGCVRALDDELRTLVFDD